MIFLANRAASARTSLVYLVLACLIPACLAGVGFVYYSYQHGRDQIIQGSVATVRALAQVVDRDLMDTESSLLVLAGSPYLDSGDLRDFYQQAKEVPTERPGENVVLTDLTGQQIANTLLPFGGPLPKRPAPVFNQVVQTGEPAISGLFLGGVGNRPVIAVAVPVRRGNRVAYVLSMGISPNRLADILSRQHLAPELTASILDGTGTLVARTRDADRFVGRKGTQDFLSRIARTPEGSFEGRSLSGADVTSVFSKSAVTSWTVAMAIPESFFADQLWQSLSWVIVVMILIAGGSLALAMRIGGRIARSITGLTEPALALGRGQSVVIPQLYIKESQQVGQTLADAARMLQEAQYLAQHDVLTELANRALFNNMVRQNLSVAVRTGQELAVLFIDLDGFKAVNDRHGHGMGDALLKAVAERLKAAVRGSDVVARFGGDEFAALLVHSGLDHAAEIAGKLVEAISAPYEIGGVIVNVSASIGVAGYPETATADTILLQRADEAMYRAKNAGKRRYVVAEVAGDEQVG